jgi:hypothetical protein
MLAVVSFTALPFMIDEPHTATDGNGAIDIPTHETQGGRKNPSSLYRSDVSMQSRTATRAGARFIKQRSGSRMPIGA